MKSAKTKQQNREQSRKWRKEHRKEYKEYKKNYRKDNLEKIHNQESISRKRQRQNLRNKITQLLGNKCSNINCPVPKEKMNIQALQIDHINNGGTQERKKINNNGIQYYRILLKKIKLGSKDYQLLCAYCNWLKRMEITK